MPLRHLVERLRSEIHLKLGLACATGAYMVLTYLAPQYLMLCEPRRLGRTAIDDAVPFDPGWVWVYASLYPYLVLLGGLGAARREVRNLFRGIVLMYAIAAPIFFLFQIEGPRPENLPAGGLYGLVVALDKNVNTFPSLHVALLIYFLVFGGRVLARGVSRRAWLGIVGLATLWALLIAYSTLATKQHQFIDLPGGALLAVLADQVVWRRWGRPPP